MSDGQPLNSVARFRKRPARLVLESYSHCEVPAGCGGVVLRWRNPLAAVPAVVTLYTPVPAALLLDGAEAPTGRVDWAPGAHVAACALVGADLAGGLIMFAAVYDPAQQSKLALAPDGLEEQPLQVLTAADGTWKYSLHPPPAGWDRPAFAAADWPALTAAPAPQLDWGAPGGYASRRCAALGAACLGLPPGAAAPLPEKGNIWIRKAFETHAARFRTPPS
jgi:hypothetical protein